MNKSLVDASWVDPRAVAFDARVKAHELLGLIGYVLDLAHAVVACDDAARPNVMEPTVTRQCDSRLWFVAMYAFVKQPRRCAHVHAHQSPHP